MLLFDEVYAGNVDGFASEDDFMREIEYRVEKSAASSE